MTARRVLPSALRARLRRWAGVLASAFLRACLPRGQSATKQGDVPQGVAVPPYLAGEDDIPWHLRLDDGAPHRPPGIMR
jgi:hypothetical protein